MFISKGSNYWGFQFISHVSHPLALLPYRKWGRERRLRPALHIAKDKPASSLQKSCFPLRTAFSLCIVPAIIDWLELKGYYAKSPTLDAAQDAAFDGGNVNVIGCCSNPTAFFFSWKDPISSLKLTWQNLYSLFILKDQHPEGKNDEATATGIPQRIWVTETEMQKKKKKNAHPPRLRIIRILNNHHEN